MCIKSRETKKLPEFLREYFWDVDFEGIDLEKDRVYVLRRILEYGDERPWPGCARSLINQK